MKNIIVIFALLISINLSAQEDTASKLNTSIEISQGFKYKDNHWPQWYSFGLTIKEHYTTSIKGLSITAPVSAIFSDGIIDYRIGTEIGFDFYNKKDSTLSLGVFGSVFAGDKNKNWYGGGIKAGYRHFYILLRALQEYNNKELFLDGSVGINLF